MLKYTLLIFAFKKAMRPAGTRQCLPIIWPIMKKKPSKSYYFDGFWSEWGDSNSRHLAPKASALPTALHPVMKFSNCGQTCGQRRFLTSYRRGEKCCQPKCPKAFRVFRGLWLEPETHAPKASALPTALHPVMELFYLWSFMWSWPFFDQRLCGNGSRFW